MKSILRSHYIFAIITIAVLIFSAGAFLKFFSSMKVRETRVLEARDRLASFELNRKIFAEEAIQIETIKERVAALEKKILTEESIPELLSSFENMAKAKNVDFAITVVENTTKEATPRLHIDFSAAGSYANLQSLVDEFLSQAYLVRFTRFSVYLSQGSEVAIEGKPTQVGSTWQLLAGMDIISF